MKKENVLFNGIIYDKKQEKKNKSNNYLTLTENRFKSTELNNNKLNFLHNSNNSNNPTLSNGESNKIHKNKNKYKYN